MVEEVRGRLVVHNVVENAFGNEISVSNIKHAPSVHTLLVISGSFNKYNDW